MLHVLFNNSKDIYSIEDFNISFERAENFLSRKNINFYMKAYNVSKKILEWQEFSKNIREIFVKTKIGQKCFIVEFLR